MKTESEGPHALRDFINHVGVPFSFRNDNSKTGKSFMDLCNVYTFGTETTELQVMFWAMLLSKTMLMGNKSDVRSRNVTLIHNR